MSHRAPLAIIAYDDHDLLVVSHGSIIGSYHKVSVKHLEAYLDELEWRFNNRKNPYLFRDTLLKLIKSDNLPYQKLTKENHAQ